jgi:hypothetical protein
LAGTLTAALERIAGRETGVGILHESLGQSGEEAREEVGEEERPATEPHSGRGATVREEALQGAEDLPVRIVPKRHGRRAEAQLTGEPGGGDERRERVLAVDRDDGIVAPVDEGHHGVRGAEIDAEPGRILTSTPGHRGPHFLACSLTWRRA